MATKKSQKTDNESKQLNLFNFGLAIIFFIQAILVVLLSRNVLVPVNTHFLTKDNLASQAAGHIVWAEASRHLFDIRLANLLALILVIAAIVHLLAATA